MKIFFLLFQFVFICFVSNATILTVDNNYPRVGQFASLQEAHDAANNGDTIYVFPSLVSYSTIKIYKKLYFIGSGFLSSEIRMRASLLDGLLEFLNGSGSSTICGFGGTFDIFIDANNVSVLRNKVKSVNIAKSHLGTIISQNYIHSDINSFIVSISEENEVLISNNIIKNHCLWYGPNGNNSNNGKGIYANKTTNTSIIVHNIIDLANLEWSIDAVALDIGTSNTIVCNNIILTGLILGNQSSFSNNLISPIISDVFEDRVKDNFHLKPGSPAIGSGTNGTDIGIYGGETPFIDGGYPSMPIIYFLEVPLVGSQKDGINVMIKAKTN